MNKAIYLLLIVCVNTVVAQPDFERLMQENTLPISEDFKGPGWKFLVKNGAEADYLLVGEDHGLAQVPIISEALFKSLNRRGYEYLAIETGPFTAELLSDLVTGNDESKVQSYYRENPFSVPFYGMEEEFQLLQTVFERSKYSRPIWGLDQEFILSARGLFKKYKDEFESPANIMNEIAAAEAGYNFILSDKKQDSIWLVTQTPEKWKTLKSSAKTEVAKQLVDELKLSQEIYQLNFSGKGLENNQARVDHFVKWFEKYEKDKQEGKVMIKMGATHTVKGQSFFGVYDLGDYLSKKEGVSTFHVALIQTSGFQNAYLPFGDPSDVSVPVNTSFAQAFLDFVSGIIPEEGYVVLDARPLHAHMDDLPEDMFLRKLITGYDAIVLFPNATPSTIIE